MWLFWEFVIGYEFSGRFSCPLRIEVIVFRMMYMYVIQNSYVNVTQVKVEEDITKLEKSTNKSLSI